MKSLIYYPTFEINNINWLKFALLYIKELNPIIPNTGKSSLNPNFIEFMNNNNLIKPYQPRYREGVNASLEAASEIETILRYPNRFIRYLETSNILEDWRNINNQNYEIYSDKYSNVWDQFCVDSGIGHSSSKGIKVSEDVAIIYMSILANTIAEGRGVSAITDNKKYNNLLLALRQTDKIDQQKITLASDVINLKLPRALEEIPLSEFINLRQKDSFNRKLMAFHSTLDSYLDSLEEDASTADYLDSLQYSIKELTSEIVVFGLSSISVGLGVWFAVNDKNITNLEVLKEVSSIGGLVGGVASIKNIRKKTETKRFGRKFLSDLTKMDKLI
ncbi:hypothetical protein [Peribacillus frigoritolerans]|uniref:hypothetical protein n=1 Tax=Peribacillus frigoritolerans TaxID=450367 RepID=UPI00207ABE9C|nr:hypothetical protein [Peribacillus frigoritolerans]USK64046.1 hypothetical protein LIT26_23075 [Peribacillus frigoritolerans]